MDGKNSKTLGYLLLLLSVTCFAACNKSADSDPVPPTDAQHRVFISCEGSLGNGNAALSMYLPTIDSVYEDVFKSINQQSLGDVFQSMQLIGNNYFLCVNNSDKVVVVSKNDLKYVTTINIPKPRYILPVDDNKAYVSTLFSNKVYIINPKSFSVSGSFSVPAQNPEGMLKVDEDRAIICAWDTSNHHVHIVNVHTDQVVDSFNLGGYAPQEALMDKDNKIWILSGNVAKGKNSVITCVDPTDWHQLAFHALPTGADAIRPTFNNARDTLYFIEVNYNGGVQYNGIFRMSVYDTQIPVQPFIQAQQFQYFWALGVEPGTGYIYVGDPKGFVQRGSVSVYRQDGSLLKQFSTALGPGHFYFDY